MKPSYILTFAEKAEKSRKTNDDSASNGRITTQMET